MLLNCDDNAAFLRTYLDLGELSSNSTALLLKWSTVTQSLRVRVQEGSGSLTPALPRSTMPKPTIEFTPTSTFEIVEPPVSEAGPQASYRVLAEDTSTGDKTILLIHPPSQVWGGADGKESQASHAYWEVWGSLSQTVAYSSFARKC